MTAIAVIFILIAMIGRVGASARQQAMRKEAAAMIGAIEIAIEMFQADLARYPDDDNGIGSANLYDNLVNDTGETTWYGPYMEFKDEDISGGHIVDPWGENYNYDCSSPSHNSGSFDLWSKGPDKANNTSDDVTNW
ncbi:MAG: type II secretion system protein GspG [Candidatus Omnitrophica bacterium]|nr:type II secretion system protein GspG [Candidatus Omnitrophota bacterium]